LAQLQPDQPFGTQTAITGPDFDFTWGGGQLEISPGKLSKINMEPACIRIFVGYPHFKSIFSICNQFNFNDRAFAWSLVNGSWLDG